MRGTLLLLACLLQLVVVASKKQHQVTKDHGPITHEHESHDEYKEGSIDSGNSASGSGEGKIVNLVLK